MKEKKQMTNKRRTEITIETHEITVIKTNGKSRLVFCEHCQKSVAAFAPEQVALFFRLSLAEVCLRVQTEQIHLTRRESGAALICGNSHRYRLSCQRRRRQSDLCHRSRCERSRQQQQ